MIEETGEVVKVEGDTVQVETERASACAGCAVNSGCGTAVLSRLFGNRRNRVWALNTLGVEAGDRVVIGLHEQALVRGSFAMYGIPLAGLLGGALLGESVGGSDLFSIIFALFGLAGGLFWLRSFGHRIREDARYQARVLRPAGKSQ